MFTLPITVASRGRLTVLLFHKVPALAHPLAPAELGLAQFEKVLALVSKMFKILPLPEALHGLSKGNLPDRAACITFDDGYPEWLKGAVPLLERYQAHATFFVTTGQFKGVPMWNERILYAVERAIPGTPPLRLQIGNENALSLDTPEQRMQAVRLLDAHLKYQSPAEKERLLQWLEHHTGARLDAVPVMSTDDLRAIHARGFGIGAHSVSHPILSCCSAREAMNEIGGAKEDLEGLLRAPVSAFAYPNGLPLQDFDSEHIEMVKRAGYSCALTTHRGAARQGTSLFQIPRFTPWGPSKARMQWQLLRNLGLAPRTLPEPGKPRRRALMVAFHFPPQSGSSGILRTLNFTKNLPDGGWAPSVLTAQPKAYTETREDLIKDIPATTTVLRAHALDAARHLSIRGKYPSAFALPDRWSSWWPCAVWVGLKHIRTQRPDVLWSTYPISTAHLIGASLHRLTGLPWVADFRDPMVSADYPSHPLQRAVWTRLERHTLQNATACVFTTARAAQTYRERYPEAARKCLVIENGFDEAAFSDVQAQRFGVPVERLLLLHSGLIYPKDRDPSSFFAAVQALIADGRLDRSSLCIRFRAPHHAQEVLEAARTHGLDDVVDIAAPVSYRDAIAEMMGADLLLVFQGSYFNAQIPAKIYEYLRAARPILAIVDPLGDTASQLSKFEAVHVGDISSPAAIGAALMASIGQIGSSALQQSLAKNQVLVKAYSRASQARALTQLLDSVLVSSNVTR